MTNKRMNSSNRRCKDFHRQYLALCRSKNFQPLAEITGARSGGGGDGTRRSSRNEQQLQGVDFYGDRFKETDWQLIIDSLLEDGSLEFLAIRLRKVSNDGRPTVRRKTKREFENATFYSLQCSTTATTEPMGTWIVRLF